MGGLLHLGRLLLHPFCVWYSVSIICLTDFIVSIMAGINATICGIRELSRSMSGIKFRMLSVIASMPSSASKIERNAQQTGMS